jgi:hypothetical protein
LNGTGDSISFQVYNSEVLIHAISNLENVHTVKIDVTGFTYDGNTVATTNQIPDIETDLTSYTGDVKLSTSADAPNVEIIADSSGVTLCYYQTDSTATQLFTVTSDGIKINGSQIATVEQLAETDLSNYQGDVSIKSDPLMNSLLTMTDSEVTIRFIPTSGSMTNTIVIDSTGTHITQVSGTGSTATTDTFELLSTGLLWNSKQIATTDQISSGGGTDLSHYAGVVNINDTSGANFVMNSGGIALYNANAAEDITHELTIDST